MSHPIKYPIPNQDSTRTITQHDPILSPLLEEGHTGYEPFIDDTHFSNSTEDENTDAANNFRNHKKYYVKKMNVGKYEEKDGE